MFTTKSSLCFFIERLCLLSAAVHAHLDVTHTPGYSNELADRISRLPLDQPIPEDLKAPNAFDLRCTSFGIRLGVYKYFLKVPQFDGHSRSLSFHCHSFNSTYILRELHRRIFSTGQS